MVKETFAVLSKNVRTFLFGRLKHPNVLPIQGFMPLFKMAV